MRLARCAGINPAAADTTVSSTTVATAIHGSRGLDAVELRRHEASERHRRGNADRQADRQQQQHFAASPAR